MSSVSPVQSDQGMTLTWSGLANGQTGGAAPAAGTIFRQVQFIASGTFGSGGSVVIEGSNDATNWFALSPPALTAAGSFASLGAQEFPRYYRPHVTAGDGTTSISITGYFS